MLVDALAVSQPQTRRNFSAGRRHTMGSHELLNKSQYFQLLGAEIGHGNEYQTDVW